MRKLIKLSKLKLLTERNLELTGLERLLGNSINKPQLSKEVIEDPENKSEEGAMWSLKNQYWPSTTEIVEEYLLKVRDRIRYYPLFKSYYVYNELKGHYVELDRETFRLNFQHWIASTILSTKGDVYKYSINAYNEFTTFLRPTEGPPVPDIRYMGLKNGIYDKVSKKMIKPSHEIFITGRCEYDYQLGGKCPQFMRYLQDLCQGKQDRINLIRSYFWAVLHNHTNSQVFLYVVGPGATGKSVLTHVLSGLLPPEAVTVTRLKDLNQDRFEVLNLAHKSLIILNDLDDYKGDLSILKAFVGQDTLKGSLKYVQGSFKVKPIGLLIVVANHPFSSSQDSGGALSRRIIPFLTTSIQSSRLSLINPSDGMDGKPYSGPLWTEMSGIFNWVIDWGREVTHNYLTKLSEMVPSLAGHIEDTKSNISLINSYFHENIEEDTEGLIYVGTASGDVETELYPNYVEWVKERRGLAVGHRRFVSDVENYLRTKNIKFNYVRRKKGRAFQGIGFKINGSIDQEDTPITSNPIIGDWSEKPYNLELPNNANRGVLQLEGITGTRDVDSADKEEHLGIRPLPFKGEEQDDFKEMKKENFYSRIKGKGRQRIPSSHNEAMQLYQEYYDYLSRPKELVEIINNMGRVWAEGIINSCINSGSENLCPDLYTEVEGRWFQDEGLKEENKETSGYHKHRQKFGQYLRNIKMNAIDCNSFNRSAASTRIIPKKGVPSLNYMKKKFRYRLWSELEGQLADNNLIILDMDIKSCFVNILLAFFQEESREIKGIIDNEGIWEYVKKQMEREGKGDLFSKPWVKIAVYSSFFGGSTKAMSDGILEAEKKARFLTPEEWLRHPDYESKRASAIQLADYLNCSSIIKHIRSTSIRIQKLFKKWYQLDLPKEGFVQGRIENIVGPLGHPYPLDNYEWRKSYSRYLQEIESALVTGTFIRVREKFTRKIDVLLHCHDGILIVSQRNKGVPLEQDVKEITELFNSSTVDIAILLGANHPHQLEWEVAAYWG